MNSENRILFEKPDLEALKKNYTVVDLHFHSLYSDGNSAVEEIAECAAALGIGISVTDHNEIRGAVEIDAYADVLSIPGIEVTSLEGAHVLGYFYELSDLVRFFDRVVGPHRGRDVMSSTDLPLESIIRKAKEHHGIVIFPHPFCGMYTGIASHQLEKHRLQGLFAMVDGVEVINSENLNKWNMKSSLLGFNLNKAITGGSDGHSLYQMGKVVSYARCAASRRAFLNAVKNMQIKVMGKEIDLLRKFQSNGIKLRTNLKNYPDIVEKNITYSRKVINIKSRSFKNRVRSHINGRFWHYDKH